MEAKKDTSVFYAYEHSREGCFLFFSNRNYSNYNYRKYDYCNLNYRKRRLLVMIGKSVGKRYIIIT